MARMQEELAARTVEASAGGGMITVVASGKQEIVSIKIEPEVIDGGDREMLQDLVVAAVNDAMRKAKEMLFTVVDRETKYKSKNFIDTAIYRGSDVTASWIFKGLSSAGMSIAQMTWVYLPVMALWVFGAWRLGRICTRMREQLRGPAPDLAPEPAAAT